MVNEEFIATLDYLVASSLWASITDARDQVQYYLHRVNYYKTGKRGNQTGGTTCVNVCLSGNRVSLRLLEKHSY